MNVAYALFADAANLSQEGKLNILGVFDAVQVGSLPAVHRRATLVVQLKGGQQDVGAHKLTLRWLNPFGEELWASHGELQVPAPADAAGLGLPILAAVDLPLDQAGVYAMQVTLDDALATSVPLHVRTPLPALAPGTMLS